MKVMHVVLSLDVGGLERNVLNQVREGCGLGQQSSVLCLERPGTLASRAEELGARVVCVDKTPGIRPGIVPRIRSVLEAVEPDVVHTHQIGPLFYTGLASHGLGIPLIVHTEHGREDYAGRRLLRWLGRVAGMHASCLFCLTQDMADGVIGSRIVPRGKVRLIHNGIDLSVFRQRHDRVVVRRSLGIAPEAVVVGTVGRLTEVKNQELLIRAFAQVKGQIPEAHLILVGDGPLAGELRDLAASLGVDESVHFAGYQPNSAPYLQAFDVFALTSRSEGMPQSVLEASACGIPVVASRVGGLPELIEHGRTGVLFDPGDQPGLESALMALLADPPRARELGAAGRAKVESLYDVGRMARDYHQHFVATLGNRCKEVDSVIH